MNNLKGKQIISNKTQKTQKPQKNQNIQPKLTKNKYKTRKSLSHPENENCNKIMVGKNMNQYLIKMEYVVRKK